MHEVVRLPAVVTFAPAVRRVEAWGFAGVTGTVTLEGQFLLPADRPSRTLYVLMHPTTTLQQLPLPTALAQSGLHVLCAASRYAKNDSTLILENVLVDLDQWIRAARQQHGYEKVVLIGWSGGGALALLYCGEAQNPSITATPAGDPVDQLSEGLVGVDGLVLVAAHMSRAQLLTEWLDPSVVDEANCDARDPELDIYSMDATPDTRYSAAFQEKFRAGQAARNRRITDWALEELERLAKLPYPETDRAFVVQRTMCDIRFFDLSIDPNGRPWNHCLFGDPRKANLLPAGMARYSSLRSWLSQWSHLSNGSGARNAAAITAGPVLMIQNGADEAVPTSHQAIVREALATPDKDYLLIPEANHYYLGQPDKLVQCVSQILSWSGSKRLLD